jgi:hypothetical protein
LAVVATAIGYSLFNNRKAIACAMETTTYKIGSNGNKEWDTHATNKSRYDFIIDYTIWKETKVIQVRKFKIGEKRSEEVTGVTTDNEIKFNPKEPGCQSDGLTLNRKTLLIKGEKRCDYLLSGTTEIYTQGVCKRIKVPPIKEERNQI